MSKNDDKIDARAMSLVDWNKKQGTPRNYTADASEFDAPLSFADMKTLNATLRLYGIDRHEFMEVLNRYIQIKEDSDEA